MLFNRLVLCSFMLICPLVRQAHYVPGSVVTFFPHNLHSVYLQTVLSVRTSVPCPVFIWDSCSHVAVTVSVFRFLFFSIKGEGALLRFLRVISELEQVNVLLIF